VNDRLVKEESTNDRLAKISARLSPQERQEMQALEASGLSQEEALFLASDAASLKLFREALSIHGNAKSVCRWVVSELPRALKETKSGPLAQLPSDRGTGLGTGIGELAALVDQGKLTGTSGKAVLEEMVRSGSGPAAIVAEKKLGQVSGSEALEPVVDQVLAAHPDEVARFRAGNKNLTGFFVGLVMRAAGGQADAKSVREVLARRLG
jgi:Asp-tRNA(Asn)/Glu-tRNA(Gln) amidotransferase B subunit